MSDKLPEKGELVQLDYIRRERTKGKHCECHKPKYIVDAKLSIVECSVCGARVEPIYVLLRMADADRSRNEAIVRMQEQAEQIQKYKPHLKIIKYLEAKYRKKDLLPTCPNCHEPFFLEELITWIHRGIAEMRIKKRQEREKE